MKKIIRNVIKEDFDWVNETPNLPLDDLIELIGGLGPGTKFETIRDEIDSFRENLPEVDWDNEHTLYTKEVQDIIHIENIINSLSNIINSIMDIKDDISFIQNNDPTI